MSRVLLLISLIVVLFLCTTCSEKDNPVDSNKSPDIILVQPANNSEFYLGDTITFIVDVNDPEGDVVADSAVSWESDKDGMLGYTYSIVNSSLSVNVHNVSVTARDVLGKTSKLTFQIRIFPK